MKLPFLSRKSAVTEMSLTQAIMHWVGFGTASKVDVSVRSALSVPAVFCAARVIAEGLAQMPARVVRVRPEGAALRTDPVWDHPVGRLLTRRPNDWQTPYEFIEGMVFTACLAGNAIAIKNAVRGEIRELLPVPAGAWTVEQDTDWTYWIRVNLARGGSQRYRPEEVLHLRGPSLDGVLGLEGVREAREAIGLTKVLEVQQAKLAGNGGKPSGILSFDNALSVEARDNLKKVWSAQFGPGGDGGIAILDSGAKFNPMQLTNVDAQHLETRRFQIEEIARAFRVQPIMLMQSDKAATFASAEQMFRNHVIHTLGPWVRRFETAATRDLLPDPAPDEAALEVELDERALLRGDFKDQASYYATALGAGGQPAFMAVDEVRAEIGLDPVGEDWARKPQRGAMDSGGGAGAEGGTA